MKRPLFFFAVFYISKDSRHSRAETAAAAVGEDRGWGKEGKEGKEGFCSLGTQARMDGTARDGTGWWE